MFWRFGASATCLCYGGSRHMSVPLWRKNSPRYSLFRFFPVSFRVSHMYQNYKMLNPLKLMSLKLISSESLFPKHSRAPAHSQEIGGSGPAPSCSVSLRYTGFLSLQLKSTAEASFARRCLLLTASRHSLSPRRQTGKEEPKNSTVCCLLTQSPQ